MSRAVQVVFDCADPARVGAFWIEALGYVEEPPPPGFSSWPEALEAWNVPEEERDSKYAVVDPDGVGPRLFFQRVPEPKSAKNRVHLDVRLGDRSTPPEVRRERVLAEATRLEALGATRVAERTEQGSTFVVMQDVEGNELCLT